MCAAPGACIAAWLVRVTEGSWWRVEGYRSVCTYLDEERIQQPTYSALQRDILADVLWAHEVMLGAGALALASPQAR